MQIVDLDRQPEQLREQAARLLVEGFDEPRGWPTVESGREEVAREYDRRVWELHPLVVRREHRRRGLGRALVGTFESEAANRGALTVTLGTDDDSGMTSLAGADLYTDLPRQIAELRDLGRGHPFLFYRKLGFVVTGVVPDANGRGRPDIYMSKPALRVD